MNITTQIQLRNKIVTILDSVSSILSHNNSTLDAETLKEMMKINNAAGDINELLPHEEVELESGKCCLGVELSQTEKEYMKGLVATEVDISRISSVNEANRNTVPSSWME